MRGHVLHYDSVFSKYRVPFFTQTLAKISVGTNMTSSNDGGRNGLVEANGLAHGAFDVQGLDILPVLL